MTQPHEHYYVPAQSKWPIIATLGMGTSVYGLATWFNDMSAQRADSNGPLIFSIGGLFLAYMLFGWFGAVIKESRAGLYSAQMDRSFRWGMSWFIFSEVMFFAAFFGALFYVRTFAGPWLGGDGAKGTFEGGTMLFEQGMSHSSVSGWVLSSGANVTKSDDLCQCLVSYFIAKKIKNSTHRN